MKVAYVPYDKNTVSLSEIPSQDDLPELYGLKPKPGFLDGLGEAGPDKDESGLGNVITSGVLHGAAMLGQTALAGANWVADQIPSQEPAFNDYIKNNFVKPQVDFFNSAYDETKLNPDDYGEAGQFIYGASSFVTRAAIGNILGGTLGGMTVTGVTAAHANYYDQEKLNVDSETNLKTSAVAGATEGLFAGLPFSPISKPAIGAFLENAGIKAGSSALASIGKTIGSGADSVLTAAGSNRIATGIYGASLNTGVGIASRSAISTIFESHGYNELAAQYAPLDTAAMAADAVLGLAFGMLHFQGKDISNDPRIIPSSVIDQSLDDLRAAQEARGTNGLPIDQTAIAIDHAYTEAMFAHITEGIPFETNPDAIKYVQKHSVPDEQTQQLITTGKKTIEETFDPENIGIFEQPHETVLPETQFVLPDEQNANSETKLYPNIEKYLDPIHIENINQIAQSDPYMEIETPDGTYVHAKDYMNHVENDLANTSKDGDLLDAAVACFTRVGL